MYGFRPADLRAIPGVRVRLKERLRTPDEALCFAADAASTLLAYVDSDLRVCSANKRFETGYGGPARAVTGKPLAHLMGPREFERLKSLLNEALKGHVVDFETVECGHLAEHRISARCVPDVASNGVVSGFAFIGSDITQASNQAKDLKDSRNGYLALATELEGQFKQRTQQLEQANRELEAFSYSVSHDLRTPLRTISSLAQILLLDQNDQLDDEGKDNLARIVEASLRMSRLIDDLLRYARLSRAQFRYEPVNLTEMATSIMESIMAKSPERRMQVKIGPNLAAHGSPELLRVVMENLLENAWKFTSKTSDPCIEVGSFDHNGETVYFVRDNGAGFDMKYAHKLFKPFERLHGDSEFPGTGIGLVNVQRIVLRHGGRMWANAAPDHGATFYFTLPSGIAMMA